MSRKPPNGSKSDIPPLSVWVGLDIFEQLVKAVNPEADVAEEIRRILRPVVASSGPDTSPPQHGQKFRLYNRIVQSMQDMYGFLSVGSETGGSPLILVIEDVQWADPSTAELFSFLVHQRAW